VSLACPISPDMFINAKRSEESLFQKSLSVRLALEGRNGDGLHTEVQFVSVRPAGSMTIARSTIGAGSPIFYSHQKKIETKPKT